MKVVSVLAWSITVCALVGLSLALFLFYGHDVKLEREIITLDARMDMLSKRAMQSARVTGAAVKRLETLRGRLGRLEDSVNAMRTGNVFADPSAELHALRGELDELRDALADGRVVGNAPLEQVPAVMAPPVLDNGILFDLGGGPQPAVRVANGAAGSGNNPQALRWSPEQATGEPDTLQGGDIPTAWAPKLSQGGLQWIELDFGAARAADGVLIRETHAPGAVVRVDLVAPDGGGPVNAWQGEDPTREAPGELLVEFDRALEIATVRVTLDTDKVDGWNEIDAVALVKNGELTWATGARASSSYSELYERPVR